MTSDSPLSPLFSPYSSSLASAQCSFSLLLSLSHFSNHAIVVQDPLQTFLIDNFSSESVTSNIRGSDNCFLTLSCSKLSRAPRERRIFLIIQSTLSLSLSLSLSLCHSPRPTRQSKVIYLSGDYSLAPPLFLLRGYSLAPPLCLLPDDWRGGDGRTGEV